MRDRLRSYRAWFIEAAFYAVLTTFGLLVIFVCLTVLFLAAQ